MFLYGKQQARQRTEPWTQQEREELGQKTLKLMSHIHGFGVPESINPIHSKKGLPRISSQAGYAAVYDKLVEARVIPEY
jgi:hypothetical protein